MKNYGDYWIFSLIRPKTIVGQCDPCRMYGSKGFSIVLFGLESRYPRVCKLSFRLNQFYSQLIFSDTLQENDFTLLWSIGQLDCLRHQSKGYKQWQLYVNLSYARLYFYSVLEKLHDIFIDLHYPRVEIVYWTQLSSYQRTENRSPQLSGYLY